jgi:hypothetical protein
MQNLSLADVNVPKCTGQDIVHFFAKLWKRSIGRWQLQYRTTNVSDEVGKINYNLFNAYDGSACTEA